MSSNISVIIVTLNAEATLQKCLNSIYTQQLADIKIIIIDGGSTDQTIQILNQNSSRLFYWKSEPDKGIYDAMNKALEQGFSNWVYFLGSDDELLPDFSVFAASLNDEKAIYYANVLANGQKRLGRLNRYQTAKYGIYHQAMIFPASLFKNLKYDLKYKLSADYALILTMAGIKGLKFIYKDFTIAIYNHTGISGREVDSVFQNDKARLIFKNFGLWTWLRYKIHKYKHLDNPRA